ncbi:MAG TPA: ribulose-phosphate 3-epimerase [Methanomassiliicoccales archaeon]|nr:ribulose-phosphate 3-epimerase [Methanomassiliicoccales archaeon]
MVKVAPSILSADFARLGEEIRRVEAAQADWIHIDVMDGVFVPNLTIGPEVIKALRPHAKIPFDVHLMIEMPERYVERFAECGADCLTVHVEATHDVKGVLAHIRRLGMKAGISLNPGTELSTVEPYFDDIDLLLVMTVQPGFGGQSFRSEVLPKISQARRIRDQRNLDFEIVIDGGINRETGKLCVENGATVLAAGSALFKAKDMAAEIDLWHMY